jgi:hypothetical protein
MHKLAPEGYLLPGSARKVLLVILVRLLDTNSTGNFIVGGYRSITRSTTKHSGGDFVQKEVHGQEEQRTGGQR